MIAPPLIAPFVVLAGVCVGSFAANAAVRRGRAEQALVGRSHCDGCDAPLSFTQSLPVVSFVRLGGVCANCGTRIDTAHLVGEIGGGLVAACAILAGSPGRAVLLAALGFALLASALADLKTRKLPDLLTLAAAVLAACLAVSSSLSALIEGCATAAIAFIVLEAVRRGFLYLRREPGLGFGDVKLVAALALWLGLATPWAVALASVFGLAAFGIARPKDRRMAFGPSIALAAWLVGMSREVGWWRI